MHVLARSSTPAAVTQARVPCTSHSRRLAPRFPCATDTSSILVRPATPIACACTPTLHRVYKTNNAHDCVCCAVSSSFSPSLPSPSHPPSLTHALSSPSLPPSLSLPTLRTHPALNLYVLPSFLPPSLSLSCPHPRPRPCPHHHCLPSTPLGASALVQGWQQYNMCNRVHVVLLLSIALTCSQLGHLPLPRRCHPTLTLAPATPCSAASVLRQQQHDVCNCVHRAVAVVLPSPSYCPLPSVGCLSCAQRRVSDGDGTTHAQLCMRCVIATFTHTPSPSPTPIAR